MVCVKINCISHFLTPPKQPMHNLVETCKTENVSSPFLKGDWEEVLHAESSCKTRTEAMLNCDIILHTGASRNNHLLFEQICFSFTVWVSEWGGLDCNIRDNPVLSFFHQKAVQFFTVLTQLEGFVLKKRILFRIPTSSPSLWRKAPEGTRDV